MRNSFVNGQWTLEKVSDAFDLSRIDCGDSDLNDYFRNDSEKYRKQLLTQTYVFHETGNSTLMATVDFCNDALPREDMTTGQKKKIPFEKRGFTTFPAVKITRLGVRLEFHKCGIGSNLLTTIKRFFLDDNRTGCRFITVDAYRDAVGFYERNDFMRMKSSQDPEARTVPLFFDLLRIDTATSVQPRPCELAHSSIDIWEQKNAALRTLGIRTIPNLNE